MISEEFLILHLDARNSVTPIFFETFIKFLSIGQLIIPFTFFFLASE